MTTAKPTTFSEPPTARRRGVLEQSRLARVPMRVKASGMVLSTSQTEGAAREFGGHTRFAQQAFLAFSATSTAFNAAPRGSVVVDEEVEAVPAGRGGGCGPPRRNCPWT